jgi:murein DD-endopeptidase MepM/ murein hydrolase activator NlpD
MTMTSRLVPAVCLAGLLAGCQSSAPESAATAPRDIALPLGGRVEEARVPRNATLEVLLRNHDVPVTVTTQLVDAVRGVFNPRQLRANQPYRIITTLDGLLREFRYEIDADRFLRVVTSRPDAPAPVFDAVVIEYPKELVVDAVETLISRDRPSLIAALDGEGENQLLALQLADAFSGLVDFNSDLQEGDRFRALFDRVLRNGEFSGYGALRAAIMETGGRRLTAIPFTVNGKEGWYDEEGRSLKRMFLRSPLPFVPTITSNFSMNRRHPVTGNFRAHPAIDYRAAYGERVLAVATGTVVFAATSGASGRLVRIRHAGGYETMYLHLSGFKVRAGQRVQQGQVIGYVGNSGVVTATHLDFRMKLNGAYRNPLIVFRSLPPGDPIPASLMPAFFAERDRLFQDLDGRLSTSRNALRPDN